MVDTTYLPGLAVLGMLQYFAVILLIKCTCGYQNFFDSAHSIGRSLWGYRISVVLFLFRLSCTLCFASVAIADANWWFFTFWNMCLIVGYFSLATVSSGFNICFPRYDFSKSTFLTVLGRFISIVYPVAGSTAFYVSFVYIFVLRNPIQNSSDWCEHLGNSSSMFLDLLLNEMDVYPENYLACVTWLIIYVVFIWILVIKEIAYYPYFFLDLSTADAIGWFLGLFALNLIFFSIWLVLHKVKFYLHKRLFGHSNVAVGGKDLHGYTPV